MLAERIIDILVLGFLLAGTGFLAFHNKLGVISKILLLGVGLAVLGIMALLAMKMMSHRIQKLIPQRFHEKYRSFEEGALQSFRRIPLLLGLTIVVWFLEGTRLQLVFCRSVYIPAAFRAFRWRPCCSLPWAPQY